MGRLSPICPKALNETNPFSWRLASGFPAGGQFRRHQCGGYRPSSCSAWGRCSKARSGKRRRPGTTESALHAPETIWHRSKPDRRRWFASCGLTLSNMSSDLPSKAPWRPYWNMTLSSAVQSRVCKCPQSDYRTNARMSRVFAEEFFLPHAIPPEPYEIIACIGVLTNSGIGVRRRKETLPQRLATSWRLFDSQIVAFADSRLNGATTTSCSNTVATEL